MARGALFSLCLCLAANVAANALERQPSPKPAWHKAGGSGEEFQRVRAGCFASASAAADMAEPRWAMIFAGCMRAQGWSLY